MVVSSPCLPQQQYAVLPKYRLKCLLYVFQLAYKPSGCNEWQDCWWGKDCSLFLNMVGGVYLHVLICALPLLLHCFCVLKASMHACTVVFWQKGNSFTQKNWSSHYNNFYNQAGNLRQPRGYTEPAVEYLVLISDVLCVPNALYKATDKVWWSSLLREEIIQSCCGSSCRPALGKQCQGACLVLLLAGSLHVLCKHRDILFSFFLACVSQ